MSNSTRPIAAYDRVEQDADGNIIGLLPAADRGNRLASWTEDTGGYLRLPDGGVSSLSELIPEVLANATATTTVLTGAGAYAGYRCTTAAGNITVYDNTAASGKVLVPTTALTVGAFPAYGAGHPGRIVVGTGVTVVLSGAAVVYVGVE